MLVDQIQIDLKTALKSGDTLSVSTLRMAVAALRNRQIELQKHEERLVLEDQDTLAVLEREAKKRKEAATLYHQGNRSELAAQEEAELKVLQKYLPAALTDAELSAIIKEEVDRVGSEFAPLMKAVMARVKGRADGQTVQAKIRALGA